MNRARDENGRKPSKARPRAGFTLRHVRVTTRGLVVTDDPRNPPDEVGRLYPWLCVVKSPADRSTLTPLDAAGRVIRDPRNGRRIALILGSQREFHIASRAAAAAIPRAWRRGALDLPFDTTPPKLAGLAIASCMFGIMTLFVSGVAAPIGLHGWQSRHWLPPQQQFWFLWLLIGSLACLTLTAAALICTLASLRGSIRRNPIVERLTSGGVVIRFPDQRLESRPWSDIRSIENVRSAWWGFSLCFHDGVSAVLPPDSRARGIVEQACAEHLGRTDLFLPPVRRRARRLGLLTLIVCTTVLPPAMSGPFTPRSSPLPLAWPLTQSLMLAALVAFFPELARMQRLAAQAIARRLTRSGP